MAALRSFPDNGILIDAARGKPPYGAVALRFLANASQQRTFLTSPFVWLETVPKAPIHGASGGTGIVPGFLRESGCALVSRVGPPGTDSPYGTACHGLGVLDALHLAAACLLEADEFVTTEKPGKALYRTQLVRVVSSL